MRRYSLLSGISVAACVIAVSTAACAQSRRAFDIPPGDLAGALRAFATQSDQQIFFAADMVAGLRSPGVRGRLSSPVALDRILAGSGLGWSQSRPGVFTLQPRHAEAEPTPVETFRSALAVKLELPAGTGVSLRDTHLMTGNNISDVAPDGTAGAVLLKGEPQMGYLFSSDGRLLLMGVM